MSRHAVFARRTEGRCVFQYEANVGQGHAMMCRHVPVCVSPATSCGGLALLGRTDLTENERPVLLTKM